MVAACTRYGDSLATNPSGVENPPLAVSSPSPQLKTPSNLPPTHTLPSGSTPTPSATGDDSRAEDQAGSDNESRSHS